MRTVWDIAQMYEWEACGCSSAEHGNVEDSRLGGGCLSVWLREAPEPIRMLPGSV
jgi:hypothetical protein